MELHNPHSMATPSERLFAAQRQMRLERIARAAKLFGEQPSKPISVRPFRPSCGVVIVKEPEPIAQWKARQNAPLPAVDQDAIAAVVVNIKPRPPRVEDVLFATAAYYKMPVEEILAFWRVMTIRIPRQVAMYLAYVLCKRSLPEIGRRFAGRDHTTILHSVRKINRERKTNPDLQDAIDTIAATINARHEARA